MVKWADDAAGEATKNVINQRICWNTKPREFVMKLTAVIIKRIPDKEKVRAIIFLLDQESKYFPNTKGPKKDATERGIKNNPTVSFEIW